MRALGDLLETADGVAFLADEGVHVATDSFVAALEAPTRPELADRLGAGDARLVCSGQQIYVDYRRSVLEKVEVLGQLRENDSLFPFFLWVDTDRAGADNLMSKLAWPPAGKKGAVSVLAPGTRDVELRYATVDGDVLRRAIDTVATHLRRSELRVDGAKARFERLRAWFFDGSHRSLAEFNLDLSNFLLSEVYGSAPHPLLLSDCQRHDAVVERVETLLNVLPDVIAVFNEAVAGLRRRDVDPQVTPLPDDYLPLHHSCEVDGRRLRLSHRVDTHDHHAVARCKCGNEHSFHLGTERLGLGELAEAGRWSLDVSFPLFLDDMVSGFVAGKSSTLYLLVMNEVLRRVFGATPVPILATMDRPRADAVPGELDSLIFRYLAGSSSRGQYDE